MNREDPLATLALFLDRVTDEVEARGPLLPPPPDVRAKLDALAAGQLSAEDRGQISSQLRDEPEWIAYLASVLQKRLESSESADD